MAGNWLKYKNSDNVTVIVNLEQAIRFRHFESGNESYVEVLAGEEAHSILLSLDPGAYQDVIDYIKRTTGYELT
ncbi:MAG: hypothetical protein SF123_25495 [Chloroflexota bacterium]|nr:hypothetical protein [Chloroflexota bacterium]